MAFLLLPDRPSPHPALLLEEAAERIPLPPVGAGPLSHHPLSRSVTIVSARLSAPALPLPGVAPASAGGCCSCRRRFPPALLALFRPLLPLPSSASSPPSPPLPMPPKPCTNFRVSHSFAGMVTGLANLRNTVDSASETATLPESIPRFDNLDVGGSRRDKWEVCMATAGHRSPSPRQRAPEALAAPHPVARTELRPDTNSLCSGRAFSSSFCGAGETPFSFVDISSTATVRRLSLASPNGPHRNPGEKPNAGPSTKPPLTKPTPPQRVSTSAARLTYGWINTTWELNLLARGHQRLSGNTLRFQEDMYPLAYLFSLTTHG